jgi:hypothetical protein
LQGNGGVAFLDQIDVRHLAQAELAGGGATALVQVRELARRHADTVAPDVSHEERVRHQHEQEGYGGP